MDRGGFARMWDVKCVRRMIRMSCREERCFQLREEGIRLIVSGEYKIR